MYHVKVHEKGTFVRYKNRSFQKLVYKNTTYLERRR